MIAPHSRTPSRQSLFLGCLVSLSAFSVYWLTLAPDVLPGDGGEFQMAAPLLTIVHPTGYPLYLLLVKFFTLIPIGSIAYRVNLFSAVCGAAVIGMFYLVALQFTVHSSQFGVQSSAFKNHIPQTRDRTRSTHDQLPLTASSFSALIATLILTFSPTFWAQATAAEVYALNSLFVILLLGLSIYVRQSSVSPSWLWLPLAFGLALAHHRSILLLLPALAITLYPFAGWRSVWRRALVCLLLPSLLYLYTPLRYASTPYVQIKLDEQHIITTLENSPSAFFAHALGAQFGGALQWNAAAWERLLMTPQRIAMEFGGWVAGDGGQGLSIGGWVFMGLMGLGILQLIRSKCWRWLAALGAVIFTYTLFNAAYQIGDIADYYTPIYLACGLLSAQGIEMVFTWMIPEDAKTMRSKFFLHVLRVFVSLCLIALPLMNLIFNFALMRQRFADSPRAQWQRLLAEAPSNAILISNDRDEMTPLYYLQQVERTRPDTVALFPLISPHLPHVVPLTQYALETARPVYFVKPMEELSVKFRTEPQGALVHVLGVHDMRPAVSLVRESPSLKFAGHSSRLVANNQLLVALFWQAGPAPRPDIKTYVHVFLNGQRIAQSDHTPGGEFYPSSQWAIGETLRDAHLLTLPPNLRSDESVQLVVGAYLPDGGRVEGLERIELRQQN